MNNRKKKFLDELNKDLTDEDLLPQNIHKKVIFFEKEVYSSITVKYICLSYQVIFYIYNLFFLIFIKLSKKKAICLIRIYKVLYRAPNYGAIIFNEKEIDWIDQQTKKLQLNKEDKILLRHGACINYKKRTIDYNNQRAPIDMIFFFFISSYLIFLFCAYIFLFLYSVQWLSCKTILGILVGILLYVSIKFCILTYKAIIFDANKIIKRQKLFQE